MSVNAIDDVPETAQRAIVGGVLLYFAVFVYWAVSGEPIARLAADILFGFIALGVGGLLARQASDGVSPLSVAGACLVVGGVAQLVWVAVGGGILEVVSTIGVFVGIALYVYAVWIAD